jgi:hypothetical protein
LPGVSFDASSYEYILTYIDWRQHAGTQPLRLGGNDPTSYSIVRAMDEVRIWSRTLSQEEINYHFHKPPLQEDCLEGYWNFDDLRNRLKYITDKSYNNNSGTLKNNAAFIPQYPGIQRTIDTLKVLSSALRSDSVKYIFTDRSNIRIDSCTRISAPGGTSWIYNMSSLPYSISKLKVLEYLQPLTDTAMEVDYHLCSLAPEPIATPQYNWNYYYSTPPFIGKTFVPVTVSGFPNDTRKVILGHSRGSISLVLKNGNSFVGDVAMNTLRVFGQQYRPIEAESYGDVYRSWARLIEKGARDVYPSHGSGFLVEKLTKTRGISKQARIDCFPKDERIPCGKGGI